MKVSVTVTLTENEGKFTAQCSLKHKTHVKIVSTKQKNYSSAFDALSEATSTSIDALKCSCSVDIYFDSRGRTTDREAMMKIIEALKASKTEHRIRLYHS